MAESVRTNAPQKLHAVTKPTFTPRAKTPEAILEHSSPEVIMGLAQVHPETLTRADVMQLQSTIGNRAVMQFLHSISTAYASQHPIQRKEDDDETVQSTAEEDKPLQKKENKTGLPDRLKAGVENLSGLSMDTVRVHYNSDRPAKLQALAFTQGTDIHVARGQEKHLPHEAWHVVQQMQGRVRPTFQMKALSIRVNDDAGLEREADGMGEKAANHSSLQVGINSKSIHLATSAGVVQRGILSWVKRIFKKSRNPNFTIGNILFASKASGKYGSIYFPVGRIRLIHPHGPEVSIHNEGIARYTISQADYNSNQTRIEHSHDHMRYTIVSRLPSFRAAEVNQGDVLIEFFGEQGDGGSHISRGGPRMFPNITQDQLNVIYDAAKTRDNDKLFMAMQADPDLAAIQLNDF